MGVCFSAQFKEKSPFHTGVNSKNVNDLSTSSSSKVSSMPPTPRSEGEILQSPNLKIFSFSDLKMATRNFRPDSVLGEGGFGSVFKGWIDEQSFTATKPGTGIVIAVKKLNQESFQGHREWLAEVNYLGQFSHPNLVELIGYCLEDEQRLLVYEFMPRGSLENHLFRSEFGLFSSFVDLIYINGKQCLYPLGLRQRKDLRASYPRIYRYFICMRYIEFVWFGKIMFFLDDWSIGGSYFQPLSWSLRLKAALGAAKGLAFLHNAKTKVIYRDFKTSNVLLDSNYNAKLSDFGLAKDGPTGDKSHVSTRIMGTYGYAAPEYLATGHLTSKSDVYSFGVVLLEMLSGRRAVDKNRPSGEHNLVEWAKPYLAHKRKLFRVIDNRLEGQYTLDGAHAVGNISLRCLSVDPRFRPNMAEVVKELEQLQDPKGAPPRRHSSHGSHRIRKSSSGDCNAADGGGPAGYPRPQTQASI